MKSAGGNPGQAPRTSPSSTSTITVRINLTSTTADSTSQKPTPALVNEEVDDSKAERLRAAAKHQKELLAAKEEKRQAMEEERLKAQKR